LKDNKMAIFGISKYKIFNPNIKLIMFPTLLLGLLVFLFIVLVQNGYRQIVAELDELEASQKTESLLLQKLSSLREIDQSILDKADVTLIALPEINPASFFLTHIKRIGEEREINLVKFITRGFADASASDLSSSEIKLEAQAADIRSFVDFLQDLRKVLPLASIHKVEMTGGDGVVDMDMVVVVYWSGLPTQLPAITEPIRFLNASEQEILSEIVAFVKPEFVILDPTDPSERENPFN
jgi:hypothetical protein